jgi:hypothetical protein
MKCHLNVICKKSAKRVPPVIDHRKMMVQQESTETKPNFSFTRVGIFRTHPPNSMKSFIVVRNFSACSASNQEVSDRAAFKV